MQRSLRWQEQIGAPYVVHLAESALDAAFCGRGTLRWWGIALLAVLGTDALTDREAIGMCGMG
jgi:hypothetical protein